MLKIITKVSACALALVSLSACGTTGLGLPLTGNPAADAKTAAANLSAVNSGLAVVNQQLLDQVLQHCGFKAQFNVALPTPVPTGNMAISCDVPAGTVVPLSQLGSVTPPASSATTAPK